MTKPLALVVDDEPDIRELLEITLARMEVDVVCAADLAAARDALAAHDCHLCLTDMRLPDGDGLDLVREIQRGHPHVPVAMITAYGSVDAAVAALKAGAFDFVSKPVDLQVLRTLVATALRLRVPRPEQGKRLIGDSAPMQALKGRIAKLARSQAPVYISGESGTGKELVARLIHEQGPRADRSFVPVNCRAIPAELMESEFFGHRKGSFTGAATDKAGLFQAAQGGTLFLDEVAELPLPMQVKLLRAIQERAVRPVGAQAEEPVDVRILSATHKDLGTLVQEGTFRQDLYYRINVIQLQVPPLRERREDIAPLAAHVLTQLAARNGVPVPATSPEAMDVLCAYAFPGNVRELENVLERAMTLAEDDVIRPEDMLLPEATAPRPPSGVGEDTASDLDAVLGEMERERLLGALEEARGNKTAAARLLGLSFGAFRYRLQKLGLD